MRRSHRLGEYKEKHQKCRDHSLGSVSTKVIHMVRVPVTLIK